MRSPQEGDLTEHVKEFLQAEASLAPNLRRERSWDFCFSYFQAHPEPTRHMETSCLQLGYYLASWGMLRGSSFLFRRTNLLHYKETVRIIERYNPALRGWDVPNYMDPAPQDAFAAAWTDLRTALLPEGGSSLTLVSKVMMGVWGCIPSFDSYFKSTFKRLSENRSESAAWNRVDLGTLALLHSFYARHKQEIERIRSSYRVWTYGLESPSSTRMPVAKVLDIYGFHDTWKRR